MSSTYVDKPISLIEKKKQQWAKEREELAGLCGPWSVPRETHSSEKPFQRNRYVPKLAMANNNEFFRKDDSGRRSSLPPLYKNQYNSIDQGGETSGYGSDNPNQNSDAQSIHWNQSGYESSSSYKEDRPKWKDKTRFWETKENEPPNWVKRGLENNEEIVVSNTSPAESPQHEEIEHEPELDRPTTGYSNSYHKTYIRGQNVPLDSTEIAERERRRQVALAHQEAIRQQLEERERKRQEEREKRIKEEQEEELRIEREQEIERKRKEHELRLVQEKQERERKRKEVLQEALEQAEREAKLEKQKLKMMRQHNNCHHEIIDEKEKINNNIVKEKEDEKIENKITTDQIFTNNNHNNSNDNNNNINKNNDNNNSINKNNDNNNNSTNNNSKTNNFVINSTPEMVINNEINNIDLTKNLNRPKSVNEEKSNNSSETSKIPATIQILSTPKNENLTFVVPTPLENLQNMQYAVLLPNLGTASNSAIPIAVPLISADRSCSTARTENRVLTPTFYRNKNKNLCDIGTQTEFYDYNRDMNESRFVKEKLNNLDYDKANRKDKRNRSDDRSVEERPKWGVNRPPTRYLKQSEKDLLYQRRKMRQKTREVKSEYDYKNSSDESPTGSPRTYRKKNYIDKRQRGTWRKTDHFFTRNIRMYQTEIVPLETDSNQIYYRYKCDCCCRCNCSKNENIENKVDIMKIEHNSPRERLPNCSTENLENASYIIDKLTALHNGLLMKQEQWEKSPRTPNLSASTRHTENN